MTVSDWTVKFRARSRLRQEQVKLLWFKMEIWSLKGVKCSPLREIIAHLIGLYVLEIFIFYWYKLTVETPFGGSWLKIQLPTTAYAVANIVLPLVIMTNCHWDVIRAIQLCQHKKKKIKNQVQLRKKSENLVKGRNAKVPSSPLMLLILRIGTNSFWLPAK